MDELRFAWWNVQDFGHYAPERAGIDRWPTCAAAYSEKCQRVDAVLNRLFETHGKPHVMGLAEISSVAAHELRDRLFEKYDVHSLDSAKPSGSHLLTSPELQVALIYDPIFAHQKLAPVYVPDVPKTTRPFGALDFMIDTYRIRIYGCHLTALFGKRSTENCQAVSRHIAHHVYDFMRENGVAENRHVLLMGDLNDEPFGIPADYLHGSRSRERSKAKAHHSDRDIRRFRLYNCSWRLLGEAFPHSKDLTPKKHSHAGTFYWRKHSCWRTVDQILVSGTLLSENLPMLDESSVRVYCGDGCFHPDGKPDKFSWNRVESCGVSDHLPVVGRILLRD